MHFFMAINLNNSNLMASTPAPIEWPKLYCCCCHRLEFIAVVNAFVMTSLQIELLAPNLLRLCHWTQPTKCGKLKWFMWHIVTVRLCLVEVLKLICANYTQNLRNGVFDLIASARKLNAVSRRHMGNRFSFHNFNSAQFKVCNYFVKVLTLIIHSTFLAFFLFFCFLLQ